MAYIPNGNILQQHTELTDKGMPQISLCSGIFKESEFGHLLGLVWLLLPLVFSTNEAFITVTQYFHLICMDWDYLWYALGVNQGKNLCNCLLIYSS